MILGIGTDIVSVRRMRESIERTPGFAARVFSDDERAYCDGAGGLLRFQRYAVRFAAKEAFLKACGTGLGGFTLKDITVAKYASGRPRLKLKNSAREKFDSDFGGVVHLSLSHTDDWVNAVVVVERL